MKVLRETKIDLIIGINFLFRLKMNIGNMSNLCTIL